MKWKATENLNSESVLYAEGKLMKCQVLINSWNLQKLKDDPPKRWGTKDVEDIWILLNQRRASLLRASHTSEKKVWNTSQAQE